MSLHLTIAHGSSEHKFLVKSTAILQTLCDQACKQFKVESCAADGRALVAIQKIETSKLHTSSSTWLDHSTPIRLLNLTPNSQLKLAPLPDNVSPLVAVTAVFEYEGKPIDSHLNVSSNTTLLALLESIEKLEQVVLLNYIAIPPVQKNVGFELHINRKGKMNVQLRCENRNLLSAPGNEGEMAKTTLHSLGFLSTNIKPRTLKLHLTFEYEGLPVSDAEAQSVIQQFHSDYQTAVDQEAELQQRVEEAAKRAAESRRLEKERQIALRKHREDQLSARTKELMNIKLPSHRNRRLFQAPPGLLPSPEVDESFYEVQLSDSELHARSILAESKVAQQSQKDRAAATEPKSISNPLGSPLDQQPQQPESHLPSQAGRDHLSLSASVDVSSERAASLPASAGQVASNSKIDSAPIPAPLRSTSHGSKQLSDYALTRLRIRLPDHLYCDATFKVDETCGQLCEFVNSILSAEAQKQYSLHIAPPKMSLLDKSGTSFASLGLYPSAIIHCTIDANRAAQQQHAPAQTPPASQSTADPCAPIQATASTAPGSALANEPTHQPESGVHELIAPELRHEIKRFESVEQFAKDDATNRSKHLTQESDKTQSPTAQATALAT